MTKITVTIESDDGPGEGAKYEHLITKAFEAHGFLFAGLGRLFHSGVEVEFVHNPLSASIATLGINVDVTQVKEAIKALNNFMVATARAEQAVRAI